jgi:CDP-glycerol glycerophosphotransferase
VHRVRHRVKQIMRSAWGVWNAEVRALWRRSPVRSRTVLYESFGGNGALCNPEALFRELLAAEDMTDLRHIWVLKDIRRHRAFRAEFAGHPGVTFVRYRSIAYFRAVATSQYLINNATFAPEFSKREGQVYVNTWHGTPLKLMGYDMANGAVESANTLRNFVAADFLLSQNSFMTQQMYATAYKLRGAFRGLVIEEGAPRVDRQFLGEDEVLTGRARLEAAGIPVGEREIVLFAPTWKGKSFSSPVDDARGLIDTVRELQRLLGEERYVVILKSHQIVHRFVTADAEHRAVLVPNDIPTNVVLGLSSILITDYSSIFFDFLSTGRPIVFFAPDGSDYADSRGTYFPSGELPGPECVDVAQVAHAVRSFGDGTVSVASPDSRYEEWRRRFAGNDDGAASRRVVDVIFRGGAADHRTVSLADDPRTAVLLHLGAMNSNGITTSALNLLNSIDHDVFDVSVVFTRPTSEQQRANQLRINPRVRQFHRTGAMNGSRLVHLRRRVGELGGRTDVHASNAGLRRMWDDEWSRCFGAVRFERTADFDGYGPFWATLLLHGPASHRSIWLHNNMMAETHRIIRGRERIRRSLRAVFALYHEFDSLVSVSPSLSEVNRGRLASEYELNPASFVSARNLVDESFALDGMRESLQHLTERGDRPGTVRSGMPAWAAEMSARVDTKWFVTLGRFSTEKNHARLLRAFAEVHRLHPESRLVLVGYGPLRDTLDRLVHHLDLAGCAFLVGPYGNPFPILAAADCFVLSSDYEGQPMVILEAAIVGLPIVSVNFGSIRDAVPDSHIHIVDQDDRSLAEGMLAFLREEVPPQRLDAESYNRMAIGEFVRAITTAG